MLKAIEEETKPYQIIETSQIILEAELFYDVRGKNLAINFVTINASDQNVITDRINYLIAITDREVFTKIPDRQSIQTIKGTILERKTILKGSRESFSKQLIPSPELLVRLSEVTYEDTKNLRWIVYPTLIVETKNQVLKAKYIQNTDEKMLPIPKPIKTV